MAYKLIGKNFIPPDLEAKVTGAATYAEDFRADGMAHVKFYGSPMPHGKVRSIDLSEAEKVPGFLTALLPEEVKHPDTPVGLPILSNEPTHFGQPILAIAAETEQAAADAIAAVRVDMELLPFVVDPLHSLQPDGPNAVSGINVAGAGIEFQELKWSGRDFALAGDDTLPKGKAPVEWSFGDIEEGFAKSAVIVEESFVHASNAHHALEPRSAAAYWEGGKCYVWGSTQSTAFAQPGLANLIGIEPSELVLISEYCGGGFGGKAAAYPLMALPALVSRKLNGRPCLLRVSRKEEYNNGSARAGFQGWAKLGFSKEGRMLAADIYVVQDLGATSGFPDFNNVGSSAVIIFQPESIRFRAIPVLTNTVSKGAQRGPGENQAANMFEPLLDKAARELGIDRLALRLANAPGGGVGAKYGPEQGEVTSAYLREALQKGAEAFNWVERSKQSGMRNGSKVRGYGIGQAYHTAGSNGFDGLVRITPDGLLHVHTGVGNLGTYSYASTSRIAAEVLGYDWERVVLEYGGTTKHLPWNLGQFGSNTNFTMARTNYVAAMDAAHKLKEIAAATLGGTAEEYELKDERVVKTSDPSVGMSFAEAAQKAIEMGGRYDGHELPEDIHPMTQASARAIAGTGLIGVAKDNLPKDATVPALAAAFIEVDVDVETGKVEILDYHGVADCGTVIHPMGLAAQVRGGAVMGFGLATSERHVYDPQYGRPNAQALYQSKPKSYLDVPLKMSWDAVDQPDTQSPLGTKGIGEPLEGAASSALICAISDALGGHLFNRTPVVTDMIVNAAEGRPQSHKPLATNTV
ncbi:xanthine dehydrogenase family protein molybdopterin-binding subunit [Chelativorans sp. SCAU2101]|mgnify:CR=1 FL=1|uniref:Xanthine dehydrogenase family protein molybdopterin-binding subunit n=1 Tax=Chelativorans petroleitrophicus TaxID=2975484 RepID=A0A9X2X619_9HYPH|nr:xanthine dehydrogenase family protein molybdopterin-binding subunit [Chelativorans petroleitrophicus]MCT8988799.1 xanthine dehydrogenase family protein molybdopterin-binding subunit [Chelativorans petroleitrophicus]